MSRLTGAAGVACSRPTSGAYAPTACYRPSRCDEAAAEFERALAVARAQGARALEERVLES